MVRKSLEEIMYGKIWNNLGIFLINRPIEPHVLDSATCRAWTNILQGLTFPKMGCSMHFIWPMGGILHIAVAQYFFQMIITVWR